MLMNTNKLELGTRAFLRKSGAVVQNIEKTTKINAREEFHF